MGRFRALPYAKALLMVVQKDGPQRLEQVAVELEAVATAMVAVPEFERVLVAPTVAAEKKTQILDAVLDALDIGTADPPLPAGCTTALPDAAPARHRSGLQGAGRHEPRSHPRLDRNRRRVSTNPSAGSWSTSFPPSRAPRWSPDFRSDRELLGGFRLQVGSRVFDGSLAGELDRLSKEIEVEQG